MKSRAEYRERRIKYMIEACFSWGRMSEEERAWHASRGISRDVYIRKCSRSTRQMDRWCQYVKKHGIIINGERIRRGKLPE
jgi:hypothetical protein|nr:MAG TPA: hypothetical protein [Caudoviricetes sp.]